MLQRALPGNEKVHGPDHTSTLKMVHDFGNLFSNQDKLDEVENMYQQTLRGIEKAWCPDE
jgi:hypothetical protein